MNIHPGHYKPVLFWLKPLDELRSKGEQPLSTVHSLQWAKYVAIGGEPH